VKIVVSGSTGLIGRALVRSLVDDGHAVVRLVRAGSRRVASPPAPAGQTLVTDIEWTPVQGRLEAGILDGADAVVHLCGESVADRWNAEKKQRIRDSRVRTTAVLASAAASASPKPKAFLCASAVGFYGSRGEEVLTEESAPGQGFLACVCREWEGAAAAAVEAGIRTVWMRFGIVLHPSGGALAKMLPPFRMGMGGPIGSGRHYVSWISLDDAVAAIRFLIETPSVSGPVNVCAPEPVTNLDFSRALGRVLHRPSMVAVPPSMLRIMFGEAADEVLLASQRVVPRRLLDAGFPFAHTELESALRHVLARA
jgi:uncharacterized protein (TIGR01777 family)